MPCHFCTRPGRGVRKVIPTLYVSRLLFLIAFGQMGYSRFCLRRTLIMKVCRSVVTLCSARRTIRAMFASALLTLTCAQAALPQTGTNPLSFSNNYFVTGDYVVAGAYNMNQTVVNGMTTGVINVPDQNPSTGKPNPGITGATSVPTGAQVIAAFLYWGTEIGRAHV